MTSSVKDAALRLSTAAEARAWTGPDMYDGLGARWPSVLVGGRRRRQALIQLHARAPLDLRPLSRSSHARIVKAVALFAGADLILTELGHDRRESAERALELIVADQSGGGEAWGYPWDVQTRWSYYRAGTPNIIVTTFAAHALAAGGSALGRPDLSERAAAAARWVQRELFDADRDMYAYHPGSQVLIHNANLLGARAASRLCGDDAGVREAVARAVRRTLAAQRADGAFPYGDGPGLEFVDSFHTGYVLECLGAMTAVDPAVPAALAAGIDYYERSFFDDAGRALLWPGAAYPEDAHSAGTAMTTLSRLGAHGSDSGLLERVAHRAVVSMVRGDHAVHRRGRWGRSRVVFVRWADAHMARGLAEAAAALTRASASP